MAASTVSLKLLIETKAKRVLFAEAGKDCVDFLFHILSLPVATIIRLLGDRGMVGSLPNLYNSLENLNDTYIQPHQNKDAFLKPVAPVSTSSVPLLALPAAGHVDKKSYRCSYHNYFTDDRRATCPSCGAVMSTTMTYVAPPPTTEVASEDGGLVKGVVTYMVMDDLVIKPMSTISSITMLTKFDIKDVSSLEEKVVNLGMNEAIKLLKTSLETKDVLTSVFC